MSDDSSDVGEPPTRRIRLEEGDVSLSSSGAADARRDGGSSSSSTGGAGRAGQKTTGLSSSGELPAADCTAANFFSPEFASLDDRQRIRWALKTEAKIRLAKLNAREQIPASSGSTNGDPAAAAGAEEDRKYTLNSDYLIDLYPAASTKESAADIKKNALGALTDEEQSNLRMLQRDAERYERKLIPSLAAFREPDESFDTLAKLDIERQSYPPFTTAEKQEVVRYINQCFDERNYFTIIAETRKRQWNIIKSGSSKEIVQACLEECVQGGLTLATFSRLPLEVQQRLYRLLKGIPVSKDGEGTDVKKSSIPPMPAPPNLLFFYLILEGYMGYSVPHYNSPDRSVPRAAVMGGSVVAALTAWRSETLREIFANSDIENMISRGHLSGEAIMQFACLRRGLVHDLNTHFLHLVQPPQSPYSLGDTDVFLQPSPLIRSVMSKLRNARIPDDVLDQIKGFIGGCGIVQDDLKRFAIDLCKSRLEPQFSTPYTLQRTRYSDWDTEQSDRFVYALGKHGLSFSLTIGSDEKDGGQEANEAGDWPRVTQLIMLDEQADLVGALLDFDISVAACAYDGVTVRVAPRAAFSLLTSTQVVTPHVLREKRNRSRVVKYFKRGFNAVMADPHCSHPSQCLHDLDLKFPHYVPSEPRIKRGEGERIAIEKIENSVEWRAQHLRGESYEALFEQAEAGREWDSDDSTRSNEQEITACCHGVQAGYDDRCYALFQVKEGHAAEFFSKRNGWTEEVKREVARHPATRLFACRYCRYEYAIWLIFSRDPSAKVLDGGLRGEVSFMFGDGYKGGLSGFEPSFYSGGAFNSALVKGSSRTTNQMLAALKAQIIAERARFLAEHLGEDCALKKNLRTIFPLSAHEGHDNLIDHDDGFEDRFVYDDKLERAFKKAKHMTFPSNARPPVGLNPERFVETCQVCKEHLIDSEFGAKRCDRCESAL